jgi:phage tail-like protein
MSDATGIMLRHLPSIYWKSRDLADILALFEGFWLEPGGEPSKEGKPAVQEGTAPLEARIARIASLFDALETPAEFLPWLAQWAAVSHLDIFTPERQRRLISGIVPLYASRGTKGYLTAILELLVPDGTAVSVRDEDMRGFVLGASRVGIDTLLDRERPFWFKVTIEVPTDAPDLAERERQLKGFRDRWGKPIRQVIELAKPAHALYELDYLTRTVDGEAMPYPSI